MSVVIPGFDPKFVLMYTTAAPTKPSYRQGILDALCYPNGHIILYSYRRQHVKPEFLSDTKFLTGKNGVIIFVDLDAEGNVTYFPLRRVKIRKARLETGKGSQPLARERVDLSLLLEDFVEYTDVGGERQWHERVQKFDGKRQIVGKKPSYFVIDGTDDFPACRNSVSLGWEDLVTAVSKSTNFGSAVFLRLDHIKLYDPRREKQDLHRQEGERLVYRLRPGSIYRLNLSVFEKFTANVLAGKETKLEVSTSAKDILAADQPFQSVVSGLAEKSTLISCKRTIEHIVATITVRVDHQKSSSALVNSPNPSIFVRISVSIWTLAAFLACVFVGGLAVSIDTDLIRELSIWCQPATLALLVKGFGALLLAVAAFLAFRKLPAGER